MEQNRRNNFNNQLPSSSLPVPPPPPQISSFPRLHNQDRHNEGDASLRRGSFVWHQRGSFFSGSSEREDHDGGRAVNRDAHSNIQDYDLCKNPSSSDGGYEKLALRNSNPSLKFSESRHPSYRNFSPNPNSAASRFPSDSHFSARSSTTDKISITDRISGEVGNFLHQEDRKKTHPNIALAHTSGNVTSSHFHAATEGRLSDDCSQSKPDLKALLDRFDELGGLESVLKSGLGEQHLSQSLRTAMESCGSRTEFPRKKLDGDSNPRYERPTISKRLIEDRLDQVPQSYNRSFSDDRLDLKRENFEPRSQWAKMEPTGQFLQENSMPIAEECGESQGFGVGRAAFEPDAFIGPCPQASASHSALRPSEIRGQDTLHDSPSNKNALLKLFERRQGAYATDEIDQDLTYEGLQHSKVRTHWVQGVDADLLQQPTEYPLCERNPYDYELSRDSEAGFSNLKLRNVKRTPLSISEEVSLFLNAENKSVLLRENDDSLSGKIDRSSNYEPRREEKAIHHDFQRRKTFDYREELANKDSFIRQAFDCDTKCENDGNLAVRSRLLASPDSNVNFDGFPVGENTGEPKYASTKYTTSHERNHRSTSKNSLRQINRSNPASKRSDVKSQHLSRSTSSTIRDRLDKSPEHCIKEFRRLQNESPVCDAREIEKISNSLSLQRDAGQVSGRTNHRVQEGKRRSGSLSRGISARLQSLSPRRKIRSPLDSGNRTRRAYSRSPFRKADGALAGSRNRSRRLHNTSPVLSTHTSTIRSRCRSPVREVRKSPASLLRIRSSTRLDNKSSLCLRKSVERLRRKSAERVRDESNKRLDNKSVERSRKPAASLREKSAERWRIKSTDHPRNISPRRLGEKSTEHSRNISPISLRDRPPLHAELSFKQRLEARSPVIRTTARATTRRSSSLTRIGHDSSIARRLSPKIGGFDLRFEIRKSPGEVRRRSLDLSLEPDYLSSGGPAFRRLSPKSLRRPITRLSPQRTATESFLRSPLRLSPRESPSFQSRRMPAAIRDPPRSSKAGREKSLDRKSPRRTFQRSSLRKRKTQSPTRLSPLRSRRSPPGDMTSRSTHTQKISGTEKPASKSPRRDKACLSHLRVLSRLSPRKHSSDLPVVAKTNRSHKAPISDKRNLSQGKRSPVRQHVGSRRDLDTRKDHGARHSLERKMSPLSSRKKNVFDRLASKDSRSSSKLNSKPKERRSTSKSRSYKLSAPGSKAKNEKVPVKDRLGEKTIKIEFDKLELKVIDEVSIDTTSDSGVTDDKQNIRSEKNAESVGTKRSAPNKEQISAAEPPKKKNFVPIVFSAADFEEKPSSTTSPLTDRNKKKSSPCADGGRRGKRSNYDDTRSRRPRISESLRDTSRGDRKLSNNVGKSSPNKSNSSHVASSSSRMPKRNKDVKEMCVAELREEIAKYDGDQQAARSMSSKEELRLLLLQAKEEHVEKKLRCLNDSARR